MLRYAYVFMCFRGKVGCLLACSGWQKIRIRQRMMYFASGWIQRPRTCLCWMYFLLNSYVCCLLKLCSRIWLNVGFDLPTQCAKSCNEREDAPSVPYRWPIVAIRGCPGIFLTQIWHVQAKIGWMILYQYMLPSTDEKALDAKKDVVSDLLISELGRELVGHRVKNLAWSPGEQ